MFVLDPCVTWKTWKPTQLEREGAGELCDQEQKGTDLSCSVSRGHPFISPRWSPQPRASAVSGLGVPSSPGPRAFPYHICA